ncbi:hypothetical protein TVAG_041140 [Trichomonas vaginalis G3]|uniref:VPS9 domain-containing protein n=1 Tax=Trichomonas vaginalis (strain ATCC PRA-98 / G3) TaxID=412133 RepID=A2FWS6_TRIV3|nr:hypothetical protein TVAGG3_0892910 [Trichomonas vaginalis G3]EAX90639.1 hypothetical protein TVAG_041140 [Trichomonas vaginalis G3]KAI5502847.1 hypothetical protein TVAGG3_0892910 [Trichomonas vaginalis G3]|eukprot:XP_001303569.1 hypothetical protein [Trichomonas vaginalis G3]
MREIRSNSLVFEDRILKKLRQRQASVGTLSIASPLNTSMITKKPVPESYVSSVPVINIPTEEYIEAHKKSCKLQINKTLGRLESLIKEPTQKIIQLSMKSSSLIQDYNSLITARQSYDGRGLSENREMFYLIDQLMHLQIKEITLRTRDSETYLDYLIKMQKYLSESLPDISEFYIVVNLSGYLHSIPEHKDKISRLSSKIAILEKYVKQPQFLPTPTTFEEQLIYPTSSTYALFRKIEKKARKKTLQEIIDEFKELTTDPEEMLILLQHGFTFGWRRTEFPFLHSSSIPSAFLHVKVKEFDPPYLGDKFKEKTINELRFCDWPYSSVVDILDELFFIINPIEGAKIFYSAMEKTAQCVSNVTGEVELLDFDTLFPLILLSVLATGLLCESRILQFIAMISTIDNPDSKVSFAASYVEAILAHLLSLDANGHPREPENH